MTPEQKAAYVNAQAVSALIEAIGMAAENQQRAQAGLSLAYPESSFTALIEKYDIHHNALCSFFRD